MYVVYHHTILHESPNVPFVVCRDRLTPGKVFWWRSTSIWLRACNEDRVARIVSVSTMLTTNSSDRYSSSRLSRQWRVSSIVSDSWWKHRAGLIDSIFSTGRSSNIVGRIGLGISVTTRVMIMRRLSIENFDGFSN